MKVTVKTMDAGSREFELTDEATVEALKKQVADKMSIPLDKQRLIFHGKVLKDDKPLKEYGVDGMVVHLVKSAPPPPGVGEPGGPVNQPRRRIVTSSVRQDDDHTITLEATQDMLFMSPEGLPSEGDIAQMTQNLVSQLVGALSSHGATGTVSAEASATDTEGKTHILTASASTQKPEEVTTKDTVHRDLTIEEARRIVAETPAPKKAEDKAKPETDREATDKATPTAPPTAEAGTSSGTAAASKEEVKSKTQEKSEAPPPRMSLFGFGDESEDPEEADRLERERQQRSTRNLYSHARTVRRCMQYAAKVLDRYDKSQERVAKKKAEDDAKRAAGIPLNQEVMVDLREAMMADRRREREEALRGDKMEVEVDPNDPFAILHSGTLAVIPSQLYLTFKDEIDKLEARARPIVQEFRRLVQEDQNLDDDELVQAQRVAITVKDFQYYIGHAYVALARLDVQLDRPAPRHLRLYAPRRTEMRRIFQQLRSLPPQPPSGYIIDIQRDGEGGGAEGGGGGGGASGQGHTTRATIQRGPSSLLARLGLTEADRHKTLAEALRDRDARRRAAAAGQEGGPSLREKLDQVRKEKQEKKKKESEAADKEGEEKKTELSDFDDSMIPDVISIPLPTGEPKKEEEAPKLETKDEEAMDTSEPTQEQEMEQDKPVSTGEGAAPAAASAEEGGGAKGGEGGVATGAEGEKKPEGEKKEGEEGEGEEDSETPQYLARLLSELITGMVAPGMEAAPNDDIHDQVGGASSTSGGGASSSGTTAEKEEGGEGSKPSEGGATAGESGAEGETKDKDEEPKKKTFAERYAGPEGTTVTIKAAPQMPTFPGLPAMDGPSVSIHNPGGGKPPEAVVNFPMPPAFQLLRMMLQRAQQREKEEAEEAAKAAAEGGGEGGEGGEGGAGEGEKKKPKPKPPPPKKKETPFVEDDGDLSSVSDAGSIDSIDSDDEGPKNEDILFGEASLKGIGEHRSMHDAMTELRDHFGDSYDEEQEEEMGMVEMLLKAISHQISVIEVMSVFQGNVEPLKKLQQPLVNFLEDKVLYGAKPIAERKETAVKNFLMNCQSSVRSVEHRVPLRDRGIDFAKTIFTVLTEVFEEGYEYLTTKYTTRTPLSFARSLKYWATRSSARFASVVRHCLDGDGPEFEETVKILMSTLFPPTTPPLILSMCSSSILKEMRRLKDNYHYTPPQMEKYLAWKDGATPTPNKSYPLTQFLHNYVTYHDNTPLPILQQESCPTEGGVAAEGGASQEGVEAGPSSRAGPQQPFSDAFLTEMPTKKRKLDTSEIQTMQPPELLEKLLRKGFEMSGAKPTTDTKTLEEWIQELKNDRGNVSSLVEEYYYSIRERLEKDPDYDPEKYPNAHKFFNVRRWVGQKKKEEEEKRKKTGVASQPAEAKKDGGGESSQAAASSDTKMDQEVPSTSSQETEENK